MPSPPFAAGPGLVTPHFATYETNGDESNGHEHGTTAVTVVIDPPG